MTAVAFDARAVYLGSDGQLTTAFYAKLQSIGPMGEIGLNLFRAQKNSERAKVYRGGIRGQGSYKGMAYDRKNWSMGKLCEALGAHGDALSISWGWKQDPAQPYFPWVLYVDLPRYGQVSFHSDRRGFGPDYPGDWDQMRGASVTRIIDFCSAILREDEKQ
jgi:hypothetical protein